jgi:hypothetical protein
MLLTPPRISLKLLYASNSDIKTKVALSEAALTKNTISYIFLITIKYN